MLQKSYYHAWNPHEILHWMSHKNKNLKKKSFERMYFKYVLHIYYICNYEIIRENRRISYNVFMIEIRFFSV